MGYGYVEYFIQKSECICFYQKPYSMLQARMYIFAKQG